MHGIYEIMQQKFEAAWWVDRMNLDKWSLLN
jgi:hypothetical protein